eukprot:11600492-Alexandrium_andersonii.AAC.1
MDDADVADIADFGAPAGEEPGGPAWPECSDRMALCRQRHRTLQRRLQACGYSPLEALRLL